MSYDGKNDRRSLDTKHYTLAWPTCKIHSLGHLLHTTRIMKSNNENGMLLPSYAICMVGITDQNKQLYHLSCLISMISNMEDLLSSP